MSALSANDMFKQVFKGNNLVNTKVLKRGKINRGVAFEIAQNLQNSKCYITVINSDSVIDDYSKSFVNPEAAEAYISELKKQPQLG